MLLDQEEIYKINRFLESKQKTLEGLGPDWKVTPRGDFQAIWSIVEENGLVRSHLRFRVSRNYVEFPSISLIFGDKNVSRVDLVEASACELNPIEAARLGLPSRVCGPHFHCWGDNRDIVQRTANWQNLPIRRPINDNITSLTQLFLWFCNEINITITSDSKKFVEPPRDLFSQ